MCYAAKPKTKKPKPRPKGYRWSPLALLVGLMAGVLVLAACGVLQPVMDAQRETVARLDELAEQVKVTRESAAAINAKYVAGEITAVERKAQLDELEASVLDGFRAVAEAMARTGDAIKDIDVGDAARETVASAIPFLPPPWDTIGLSVLALLGAGGYAKKKVEDNDRKRDVARAMRGEPSPLTPTAPPA